MDYLISKLLWLNFSPTWQASSKYRNCKGISYVAYFSIHISLPSILTSLRILFYFSIQSNYQIDFNCWMHFHCTMYIYEPFHFISEKKKGMVSEDYKGHEEMSFFVYIIWSDSYNWIKNYFCTIIIQLLGVSCVTACLI